MTTVTTATYATQNGWTKARMIEAIKLKNNGTQCRGEETTDVCRYRSVDLKNACLVGVFIPDKLYSPLMEHGGAYTLLERFSHLKEYMPLDEHGLSRLQSEHDHAHSTANIHDLAAAWIEAHVFDA